jgi:hypothetical protein
MGDRCYLEFWCLERDSQKFAEALKDPDFGAWFQGTDRGVGQVVIEEANYGWYDELGEMAANDCAFHGWHSSGSDYPPCLFAAFNKHVVQVQADFQGHTVARVGRDGAISQQDLDDVREFYEVLEQVEEYFKAHQRSRK